MHVFHTLRRPAYQATTTAYTAAGNRLVRRIMRWSVLILDC